MEQGPGECECWGWFLGEVVASNIIVGVCAHETHTHDSKTLQAAIDAAQKHRTTPITEVIADRGYRGIKQVGETIVSIPGSPKASDTQYQKTKNRKKFRRRAAIEPIIGHLKSDFRLCRNYLRDFIGDQINLLMAACAWNMAKWMAQAIFYALFMGLWLLWRVLQGGWAVLMGGDLSDMMRVRALRGVAISVAGRAVSG